MMELITDGKKIWTEEDETKEKLRRNFFGEKEGKKIFVNIEESLYLLGFQNAKCFFNKKEVGFNELASLFLPNEERLFVRFNAYRDWRDRGLIVERFSELGKVKEKKDFKKYPSKPMEKKPIKADALWYGDSLYSVIEDDKVGNSLFEDYWMGQYGIYKQDRGRLLKLNFFETVFMNKHFNLRVADCNGKSLKYKKILREIIKIREYSKQLYDVYEDWRLKGYVVKTGFKFGSNFRIYFPGAGPRKGDKWIHSKHVLHVFPKEERLLISEWARAVRVAHGVKKTFLLAIPEMEEKDYSDFKLDGKVDLFIAYRRKKHGSNWIRETPDDKPRYLMAAVAEDEHIGGIELAGLLKKAVGMGLELILSISDRETAITYYVLKKVILPGSNFEYYEIEWMKP